MIPYMEFSHRYPRGLLSMHLSLSDISKCTRPTDRALALQPVRWSLCLLSRSSEAEAPPREAMACKVLRERRHGCGLVWASDAVRFMCVVIRRRSPPRSGSEGHADTNANALARARGCWRAFFCLICSVLRAAGEILMDYSDTATSAVK